MALIRRRGHRLCDDRILTLRSLAMHHRMPVGLGAQLIFAAGFLANLLVCGLVMEDLGPVLGHEAAVLFFLGETAVVLASFVLLPGPAITSILDRADIAGVDALHQQRFVLLEFALNPAVLVVSSSVAVAFMVVLWPQVLSAALALVLVLSWVVMLAATSWGFFFLARAFTVAPGAIALGGVLLLALLALGPLALTGTPIVSYFPLCGWTARGVVALARGDLPTAALWTALQLLAAATIITALDGKREGHARQR